jgi:hypothetical protein
VIPTFSASQVIKVKVRRSDWKNDDQWPKYVEISGSKQTPSTYGDTTLSITFTPLDFNLCFVLQFFLKLF